MLGPEPQLDTMKQLPAPLRLTCLLLLAPLVAAGPQKKAESQEEDAAGLERSLEDLFPKGGLFGPGARSMAISADGAWGAYLHRPYLERRHGADLHVVELATGEVRRVTSVSVMAPFQAATRKVGEDRLKKAGKQGESAGQGAKGGKGQATWDELKERMKPSVEDRGAKVDGRDVVGESDADDEKAPRYRGVSSFVWSPVAPEMLFTSGGDVYRLAMGADDFERLTKTRESERDVAFLPDGSGMTCLAGDALVRTTFGTHFLEQLDPRLPDGMTMRQYALSPDGKKIVFLASNGSSSPGRMVNIATYSGRFMEVRSVPRTVSDDPIGNTKTAIFLYRLPEPQLDNGELVKVYSRETTGPRDVLRTPDWAPDSSKVCFSVFEQESESVHVLEASFPGTEGAGPGDGADPLADGNGTEGGGGSGKALKSDRAALPKAGSDDLVEHPATILHRFLHDGGPTTPRMMEPQYLADSRRIVLLTELAGFRHPYVLDPRYGTVEPLTSGRFEVYPLPMPAARDRLFALSTAQHPARQDVYSIDLEDGTMTRLTSWDGTYSDAAVSADGKHVLANFTSYGKPRELVHVPVGGGGESMLTNSHPESTKRLIEPKPSLFQYDNRHGQPIHGLVFEPEGKRGKELRPLIIYVYGGPLGTRKQVTDGNYGSDAYLFASYMTAEHGFVTATIDPRGMSGYGALFEKANFEQVGKPQVEDLVDGVRHMIEEYGVDPKRVGIHGWSFGGFQTQMCLYTEPEVFTCGIAGAGPTEWENYNSWYSTGTIGKSREGKTDLAAFSLLPLAKQLEGRLLLVHGMEDANVLYQDTVRVYSELLKAGKETLVELFLDPTGGHGLGGLVERVGRARKYEEFFVRCLGD